MRVPAFQAFLTALAASASLFTRAVLNRIFARVEQSVEQRIEHSAERFVAHEFLNPQLLEGFYKMPAFDWTNLIASVDAVVENFIASRFPKSSALEPELNSAVEANIALAKKVMDQYALAKLESLAGAALDKIAAKYPAAAPELAAAKAKLATLGAAL